MQKLSLLLVLFCSLAFSLPNTVVKNTSTGAISNLPVTLSLSFCEGELADPVGTRIGGSTVTCQWDVKRTWPDNSIKHALVSLIIPSINDSVIIRLDPLLSVAGNTPISVAAILGSNFDAKVVFTNLHSAHSASRTGSVLARTLLSNLRDTTYWLKGPIATEFILRGNPVTSGGAKDTSICVQYEVRFYQGLNRAIVSVVGENIYENSIQNLWYDLKISLGNASPVQVYAKTNVEHYNNSRWHKVFTWGTALPAHEIHYDIPYLISTGLIERYNLAHKVTAQQQAEDSLDWANTGKDILDFGRMASYMGMTGGRADIGPNPAWVVHWLFTQNNLHKEIALVTADCGGTFPVHYRPSDTTRLISIQKRPYASLNWWCYGQDGHDIKWGVDSTYNPGAPDDAHQPNMAYVPYLLTGNYYYLEELYYWANWNILQQHWDYRKYDKGYYLAQVRGEAWGFWRTMVEAAAIAPDYHTEKAYFDSIVRFNIHYNDSIKLRPLVDSIGVWRPDDGPCPSPQGGDCGCFSADASHLTSPWMDDFVTMMMDHAVDLGYEDAIRLRDWKLRFPTGRYGRPDLFNPYDGTAYRLATMYKVGTTYRTVNNFTTLHAKSYGNTGCGRSTSLTPDQYHYWALCALSAYPRMGTLDTNTRNAYTFMSSNIPRGLYDDQMVDFIPGPRRTQYAMAIENASPNAPVPLRLSAYPNPFNPSVTLKLTGLRNNNLSSLKVYDVQGKLAADLTAHVAAPAVVWNARQMPSGLYFVKFVSGKTEVVRRILLVK